MTARPLNIMYIITRLNIGGLAAYLVQITAEQRRVGHHSILVHGKLAANEGDMSYVAVEKGIQPVYVPTLRREIAPLDDLRTLWRLWRLMRRERPDVVHTHTSKAGFLGRIAAKLAGVPAITHTFHGHVFEGYFNPAKARLYVTLERLCASLCQKIITVSQGLQRELVDEYRITRADRVENIPTGFELDRFAAVEGDDGQFRAQHSIPPGVPLVGIVARLVPIKNHDLFLRAAQLVANRRNDVHFALVGDGELRVPLLALAQQLGMGNRVHFCGWITDPVPVYQALDVFVLSSLNEGLPGVLVEAMAAGVPVVATAVGGVPDLLLNGELGALVKSGEPQPMADAILTAIQGSRRSDRVRHARHIALERYSITESVRCMNDLYRRMLAGTGQ